MAQVWLQSDRTFLCNLLARKSYTGKMDYPLYHQST
jgi:hypothetical protein